MRLTIDVASGAPSKTHVQVEVPSVATRIADLRVVIQKAMQDLKEPAEEERKHIATYAASAKLLYAGYAL